MKKLTAILLALMLFSSVLPALAEEVQPLTSETLYVREVQNLPDDFIMGMDVSSVLALEASGVVFYGFDGQPCDLFELLAACGVNYIRVRVWVDPYDSEGNGYGGGNCDLQTAITIGQRATKYGMRLLVDFHYSDFWADPSKQQVPKAWKGMKEAEKCDALYTYTLESLRALIDAGVDVGMVQLGNETNGRFCGEKVWQKIYHLMAAGAKAVREVDPDILIAVHFTNPESAEQMMTYASKLDYYHLDYDIFATSYYPYWHGSLENLKSVLGNIQQTYGKQVMIAETSYAATLEDTDFSGNTIGEGGAYEKPYPFTVQGQANEVADLIAAMQEIGGIGVFYWEGAWITVGTESWEQNAALWETYGSGWASSYAGEYDPKDAGVYYGGSACDNQAMFDQYGYARESLKVFALVRTGNTVPLTADAVDDTLLTFDLNAPITLPETVTAVMNDGTRQSIPVEWEACDTAAMSAGGEHVYTIKGMAGGMEATCTVRVLRFNYVRNDSFEEDDASMWTAVDLGSTDQLYVEEKKADSLTGTKHYHFYAVGKDSVNFTLEQQLTALPAGTYTYSISIMGGDGGETEIYAYVKVNGEIAQAAPTTITSWNNWHTATIDAFSCAEGDEVVIGLYVRCAGAGAWGKIDDAVVNSITE